MLTLSLYRDILYIRNHDTRNGGIKMLSKEAQARINGIVEELIEGKRNVDTKPNAE